MKHRIPLLSLLSLLGICMSLSAADPQREALWAAVRSNKLKEIQAALDKGVDVNAVNEYGVSALWIAAGKGNQEVIELLVKRGADVNSRDLIWYQTPLSSAVSGRHLKAAEFLIKSGAKDTDAAFRTASVFGNLKMLEAILALTKPSQETLDACLFSASTGTDKELKEILTKAGAKPLPAASEADRKAFEKLAGTYESEAGFKISFAAKEAGLTASNGYLKPIGNNTFQPLGVPTSSYTFELKDGEVTKVTMRNFTAAYDLYRFKAPTVKATPAPAVGSAKVSTALNWPSFRGPSGTGLADTQSPPITWDVKKGENVRWKTPIPGLGHSCPVVWGNRVFVTTAVSSGQTDPKIRVGNYGDVASVNDVSKHTWQVLCLDRDSGEILWTRTAYEGVPKIKRHLKGSQANCTPAVDGNHIVACFGSEGLYCYNFEGKLLWKRDLSTLDSSFSLDQEYEWGFANSPVIHDNLCILQCDLSHDSFIAGFSLEDGSKVWSTPRDEIPSWSSPVIWKNSQRTEIVTNASQFARAYDPKTGAELWRLAKKSEATIPAPVVGKDVVYISSGNRPIQPIIAIKAGAAGDISLKDKEETNASIIWSKMRGGPYMPTPILYKDYFYTCSNSGVLACYEAATGKEMYKERMGGISYTASPVAADGRLYFCSEQGEIRVVKAGKEFELLAVNPLDDFVMATPAISNGALIVRSQHFLWSLGGK
ncbi:PQQ-binding-like beta-propeller repeat protein [Telmatocola sphagniphila]|uniref:PQQ-binding-like beta-propeller repeat protein n=1 Tax=Telmatocola sphagniphila TaxID=1123043 RepID=A0A8E6B431_9BACT|nr:PQQ-binding-like beta-propeller repeat protein [Telmatocola sphagniphila]QVL31064.1 PQQ-binding-like beta-propeller repeat protein [Telmatocola sphagniphila]